MWGVQIIVTECPDHIIQITDRIEPSLEKMLKKWGPSEPKKQEKRHHISGAKTDNHLAEFETPFCLY